MATPKKVIPKKTVAPVKKEIEKTVAPVKTAEPTSLGQAGTVVNQPRPAASSASDAELEGVVKQAYAYKGKTVIVINNESDFAAVQRVIKGLKNPMISIKVTPRQPSRAIWRSQ